MLNFHYMWRGKPLNANELRDVSYELDVIGYKSVLLTFNSESPDYLVKSAAALVPGHKIKYMIALRPYHVSPQYCAMIIEGFNQIEPNRLMFNWIAGDQHNRPEEKAQQDIFGNTDTLDTVDKRKIFVRDFVSNLMSSKFITSMPEMVFSGYSDYTIETANIFKSPTLCMIDDYRRNKNILSKNKHNMVAVGVIVAKDEFETTEIKKELLSIRERLTEYTIIGTEDEIKKQIVLLEEEGITDVLVNSDLPGESKLFDKINESNFFAVNQIIKKIIRSN